MEENNNNESQVKETVKREGKKLAKNLLKPFMKYIIIAAICLFGILLTVGLFYAVRVGVLNLFGNLITTFNEENPDKVTSGNNSSVIYIDEDTGYYKLKDDFSKKILQELEDHKVNTEFMGFADALEDQEAGASGELTEETAKELQDMIDKYIKAEVQTTFPYTGNTWWWQNDKSIDGKIKIKRAFAEEGGRTKDLDYIKYDKFCSMVENNNTNVLNKFSINPENFKLCIAKKGSTTTYYKNGSELNTVGGGITKDELDYQTYLQNYSVPLNFFITLHVISEDKEFMEEFVDMVIGGDDPEPIVLTYVETEQQYTTLYNYYGDAEKSITFTEVDEDTVLDENSIRTIYTEQEVEGLGGTEPIDITNDNIHKYYSAAPGYDKEVTISKSGRLYITKADTWLKKSEKQVSAMQTEPNGGGTQENYPIEDLPKELYNYTDWIKKDSESEVITKIMNSKLTITSLKEIIETSSFTRKYTVTDVKSELAVQEFIDLIESYPKVRNNIQTSPSNIFYLLQQQENTQRLEKIMRYVCYVLNDVDYGVTEADLEFLLTDSFLDGSSEASVGNLADYLLIFSHGSGYQAPQSADGQFYKMYGDGVGWPTIGNADLQWKSHHDKFSVPGKIMHKGNVMEVANVAQYINQNCLTKGHDAKYTNAEVAEMEIYIEKALVDEVGDRVQQVYYDYVIEQTSGLNLTRQQIYPLVAISYNFGHLPERNGRTFKQTYLEASEKYEEGSWQHNRFVWDTWWNALGGGAAGHIPSRDAQFETYVKGVFDYSQSEYGDPFSRTVYVYYTSEQISQFSYAPIKTITRNSSNEEEIFTTEQNGGTFEGSSEKYISGYYTSTTGRTFTILDQTKIGYEDRDYWRLNDPGNGGPGWRGRCNRAASAIIASGYSNEDANGLITTMNKCYNDIIPTTDAYWSQYGLTRGNYKGALTKDQYIVEMRNQLQNGGYVIVRVEDEGKGKYQGHGLSGERWTKNEHWMAVIDYRVVDGKEQIVVADYRGADWYDIGEFQYGLSNYCNISEQ